MWLYVHVCVRVYAYVCVPLMIVFQDALGVGGGIRVVVEAMRQHPEHLLVNSAGTLALKLLVKNHAANQVRTFSFPPSPLFSRSCCRYVLHEAQDGW